MNKEEELHHTALSGGFQLLIIFLWILQMASELDSDRPDYESLLSLPFNEGYFDSENQT